MGNNMPNCSKGKRRRMWLVILGVVSLYLALWISTAVFGCPQVKDALRPPPRPSPLKVTTSSPDVVMTADYNNNLTMNYVTTASPAPFVVVATFHDMRIHADAIRGSASSDNTRTGLHWWLFGLHGRL